jgi:hypothetical protein
VGKRKAEGRFEPAGAWREHCVVQRQERPRAALPLSQSHNSNPTLVPHFGVEYATIVAKRLTKHQKYSMTCLANRNVLNIDFCSMCTWSSLIYRLTCEEIHGPGKV